MKLIKVVVTSTVNNPHQLPGCDVNDTHLSIDGFESIELAPNGTLVIEAIPTLLNGHILKDQDGNNVEAQAITTEAHVWAPGMWIKYVVSVTEPVA